MNLPDVVHRSAEFGHRIDQLKRSRDDVPWYPYGSMNNFLHFLNYFKGAGLDIFSGIEEGASVVDIGAADGDVSFFLNSLGAQATIIDNRSTNYNDCRGIQTMTEMLNSPVDLIELDLDFSPYIPGSYDLGIFLGILYHLRNPIMSLMALAQACERMVMSTAVFSCLSDGTLVEDQELAALVPARAVNNDPTNFWTSTPANLRTILKRSGWIVLDEFRVGDVGTSKPLGPGDERMFCYCQRVPNWRHLRIHHDF